MVKDQMRTWDERWWVEDVVGSRHGEISSSESGRVVPLSPTETPDGGVNAECGVVG